MPRTITRAMWRKGDSAFFAYWGAAAAFGQERPSGKWRGISQQSPNQPETLPVMGRTCESTLHREALLRSEVAACYYCLEKYAPSAITEWCDGDNQNQTAICPRCGIDAVVGFNGPPDDVWLRSTRARAFGSD